MLDGLERAGNPTPLVTVVTDLVTIPPIWFDSRATLTVVPTEPALHQAILAGIPVNRLQRIGLPVSRTFVPASDKESLRRKLGWPVH